MQPVWEGSRIIMHNEGMPIRNTNDKYGMLIITVDVLCGYSGLDVNGLYLFIYCACLYKI
jgi:hypothetical protein